MPDYRTGPINQSDRNVRGQHQRRARKLQMADIESDKHRQYLRRFPVGKLKMDGSFIGQIATSPGSLAMTETERQMALLTGCDCVQVQGFFQFFAAAHWQRRHC